MIRNIYVIIYIKYENYFCNDVPVVCTLASLTQNGQLLGGWGRGPGGQAHDLNTEWVTDKISRDVSIQRTDDSSSLTQWASGYFRGVLLLSIFLFRFTWFIMLQKTFSRGKKKWNELEIVTSRGNLCYEMLMPISP